MASHPLPLSAFSFDLNILAAIKGIIIVQK